MRRAHVAWLLLIALAAGFAAGATIQRAVGLGNALRALGVPYRLEAVAPEPVAPPFEVPGEHRGRMGLFILAGQSNMVGLAPVAEDEAARPGVYVFGNDYRWRPGIEPVDDAAGQVDLVSEDRGAGVSPGVAFASAVRERGAWPAVGLVPCAKSASPIIRWQRDPSDQSLYGSCLKRALAASPMGELAGILVFQGEADALNPEKRRDPPLHASDWAVYFSAFVTDFRDDLGRPGLPVVFARLATTDSPKAFVNWETVREQQASVRLPRTAMIETDDLPLRDGLHFTAESYRAIGVRFAEAYLRLIDGSPPAQP